ncbi:MAG: proton-conducting transporter membrane subunit [Bacillota bacterium]
MPLNPGFIYFIGVVILLFAEEQKRKIISLFIPVLALINIYLVNSSSSITFGFLDFELQLLEYNYIGQVVASIFVVFSFLAVIYSFKLFSRKLNILTYLFIGSSISILYVGDFFSFLLFWELMTIFSFFVICTTGGERIKKISYYYFMLHMVGGICLLWGVLLQYTGTGSMVLTTPEFGVFFFVLAVGIKLAFIGLHTWLVPVYSGVPFLLSVLLPAYTTKVGVYAFYRFLEGPVLEYAGMILALVAVGLALKQIKLRKILSYHLISQTGFMLVGIGLETKMGVDSGFFHLVNNILYKGLLFMVAGVVIYTTGKEKVTELGNLHKKLPLTTLAAIIASLAIAGFPFFNGYVSKLLIKKAVGQNTLLTGGLFLASIGTALSFIKFTYYTFWGHNETEIKNQPAVFMKIAMIFTTILIVVLGIYPKFYEVLFNVEKTIEYFSLNYIFAGLLPIILAVGVFILASDLIEPTEKEETEDRDVYFYLGHRFSDIAETLSSLHTGYLVRYMMWMFSFLVFLGLYFLIL